MSDSDPPPDEELVALIFGNFQSALSLWEEVAAQEGELRARPGEFSRIAARAFAEGLILDCSVPEARRRMQSDRRGAVSFYEVAHEVSDLLSSQRYGLPGSEWRFVHESDGEHEPFLLVASAVLNRLAWIEEHYPEDKD